MSKINDGGPAFPQQYRVSGHSTIVDASGMSLRDWFAGQAMAAIVSCFRTNMRGSEQAQDDSEADLMRFDRDMAIDTNHVTGKNDGCVEIAEDAYAIADAMLAAREEGR